MLATLVFAHAMLAAPAQPLTTWREKVKGKWSAEATFVTPKTNTALGKLAKSDFLAAEKKIYTNFVANTKADFKELKDDFGMGEWSYEAGSEIVFETKDIISIRAGSYSYMGGAHGIGVTRTYNYGIVNGKPKRLTIWDIVQKDSRQELRLVLLGHAMANPNTDWVQEGIYNDFTETQFNRFWISRTGLTFEFDPYELGSYAAGPFSFHVRYDEVAKVIRPNSPISHLIR